MSRLVSVEIKMDNLSDIEQLQLFTALGSFAGRKLPDEKTLIVIPMFKEEKND